MDNKDLDSKDKDNTALPHPPSKDNTDMDMDTDNKDHPQAVEQAYSQAQPPQDMLQALRNPSSLSRIFTRIQGGICLLLRPPRWSLC